MNEIAVLSTFLKEDNKLINKWIYNTSGNEENWRCDEEFDTEQEAIEAGIRYFTNADGYGYEYENDEKFQGDSFQVGQQSQHFMNVAQCRVIDQATEDACELCGDIADRWLSKVSKGEELLLGDMLTDAFKKWLKDTGNEPNFYAVISVKDVKIK
ncbi:hypothetical protein D3C78_1369640 [compost metagenome]